MAQLTLCYQSFSEERPLSVLDLRMVRVLKVFVGCRHVDALHRYFVLFEVWVADDQHGIFYGSIFVNWVIVFKARLYAQYDFFYYFSMHCC